MSAKVAVSPSTSPAPVFELSWESEVTDIRPVEGESEGAVQYLRLTLSTPLPTDYTIDNYANNNIIAISNSRYGGAWRIEKICNVEKTQIFLKVVEGKLEFEWELSHFKNAFNLCVTKKQQNEKVPIKVFLVPYISFHCRMTIFNISTIDTIAQTFGADTYTELRMRWAGSESNVDYFKEYYDILDIESSISFLRHVSDEASDIFHTYTLSSLKLPEAPELSLYDYTIKMKNKSVFSEEMELEHFPFDSQDLNISLSVNRPCPFVRLIPNVEYPSKHMHKSFPLKATYDVISEEKVQVYVGESDPSESSSGFVYANITFAVSLHRRSQFYVSNVIIPLTILSLLSMTSFGTNEDGSKIEVADRLGITLTLLLTSVAYQFVVASSLPALSYHTTLDRYVWGCMYFLIVNTIECVVYPPLRRSLLPDVDISSDEKYVAWAILCTFFVYIASFCFYVQREISKRNTRQLAKIQ